MPRGDKTGPTGMGSLTGRGAGYCVGAGTPGYMNPGVSPAAGFGRGGGRGLGRGASTGGGRGRRNMYFATGMPGWARGRQYSPVPEYEEVPQGQFGPRQEEAYLRAQARQHKKTLEEIERRLDDLERGLKEETK
ncbi:MAG: DUF5320 domain-containing protein [bacterium]|nr:DUF5320 domain-containing protein [bacterium]